MSITSSNSISVSITVEGQDSAQNLWHALDYALNNYTGFSADQNAELSALRASLATVF